MKITVGLISLGCAKNLVDSEIALGYLQASNYKIVTDPAVAEIIIVNTCGFIGPAKEESIETILEMAEYKLEGNCRCLIVTGCLSARYQEELWDEIPEIDGIMGTNEMNLIPAVIAQVLQGKRVNAVNNQPFSYDDPDLPRIVSTGSSSAYLKIAEGCSHTCAFCVIPKIRGSYRSRSQAAIIAEAKRLVAAGIKEINIIAQDTTRYGRDLESPTTLGDLLQELIKLDIPWIRVLYAYPTTFSDELLDLMARHDNLVSYVDLPLQHGSTDVLKAMRRPGSYQSNLELIKRIRAKVPNVTIRSSFIVGFPGETDDDFETLLEFLRKAKLDHCGIFKFSAEADTAAYSMKDQLSDQIKQDRYEQAMEVQQEVSLANQQRFLGKSLDVLIEGKSQESDLVLVGRHQGQAPEVDGMIFVGENPLAQIGEFVKVRITQVQPYDMVGEVLEGDVV